MPYVKSIVEPQMSPEKTSIMLQHRLAVALTCNHLISALTVLYNYITIILDLLHDDVSGLGLLLN